MVIIRNSIESVNSFARTPKYDQRSVKMFVQT